MLDIMVSNFGHEMYYVFPCLLSNIVRIHCNKEEVFILVWYNQQERTVYTGVIKLNVFTYTRGQHVATIKYNPPKRNATYKHSEVQPKRIPATYTIIELNDHVVRELYDFLRIQTWNQFQSDIWHKWPEIFTDGS